jgi:hypothetical protein
MYGQEDFEPFCADAGRRMEPFVGAKEENPCGFSGSALFYEY